MAYATIVAQICYEEWAKNESYVKAALQARETQGFFFNGDI